MKRKESHEPNMNAMEVVNHTYCVSLYSYRRCVAKLDKDTRVLTLYGDRWRKSFTTRLHFAEFINKFTPFSYKDEESFAAGLTSSKNIIIENTGEKVVRIS